MKTVFWVLFALFGLFGGFALADDNPLKKMLEIKITKISPPGRITVAVLNTSKWTITVGDESNGWGAKNWRVLVLRNGQLVTYYRDPHQTTPTRNSRALGDIVAGTQFEVELDMNGGGWCDPDQCSLSNERGIGGKMINFEPNDTIFIIYDHRFTVTGETRDWPSWDGIVAAQQVYIVTH